MGKSGIITKKDTGKDNEGEIPQYECCTVCFLHVYDSGLPLARVRDHDNLEEKHILDVVESFFLKTDSGLYLNSYHTTMLGKEVWFIKVLAAKIPGFLPKYGVSRVRF